MSGETPLTIVGNLTADPELRFTQTGVAVAAFNVASTPRTFDRQRNEFVDGEPLFTRCEVWRDMAENVAESLEKGTRVVVTGFLKPNNFTDRDGNERRGVKLDVQEVGPSLRFATATPNKVQRNGGGSNGQQGGFGGQQGGQNRGGGQGYGQVHPGGGWEGGGDGGDYSSPPF